MSKKLLCLCATIVFVLLLAAPANARGVEIFAGFGFVDADNVDDHLTLGLRYHLYRGSHVTWELGFGWGNLDADSSQLGKVNGDRFLIDFSARRFLGDSPLSVFGGVGVAQVDGLVSPRFVKGSPWDDSFTGHVGLALELPVGKASFIRPDVRARWIEATEETVYEASLSWGFGRHR